MSTLDQPTRNLVSDDEASRLEKTSSWQLTKLAWREMSSLLVPVIKKTFGWLIALQAVQVIATQLSSDAMDSVRLSGREDLTGIALIAVSELVFTLVWSALWIVVIALAASRIQQTLKPAPIRIASTLNQILIEQTRVLAAVIWRIPLIVPALNQWVRLILVPFIVLFDPDYEAGERDALNQSRALSYRRFWLLSLYLTVASASTWVVDSLINADGGGLWESPSLTGAAAVVNALVSVGSALFLYALYRNLAPTRPEVELANIP